MQWWAVMDIQATNYSLVSSKRRCFVIQIETSWTHTFSVRHFNWFVTFQMVHVRSILNIFSLNDLWQEHTDRHCTHYSIYMNENVVRWCYDIFTIWHVKWYSHGIQRSVYRFFFSPYLLQYPIIITTTHGLEVLCVCCLHTQKKWNIKEDTLV